MTILRRLENYVQKITKCAGMGAKESGLTRDMVVGISQTGRCHLAGAARLYGKDFRNAEKRLSEGLAAEESDVDDLPEGYLKKIAPLARPMPYIAVDLEDIAKKFSEAQENLCWVRDASDPKKTLRKGWWCLTVDACNERYQYLPLVRKLFSTTDPEYKGWWETICAALMMVVRLIGLRATFLFDRGFDCRWFMWFTTRLGMNWIIRQKQDRVVVVNGTRILMREVAAGLRLPHTTSVPYVDKSSHQEKWREVQFGFAPVDVPGLPGRYTMLVIDHGGEHRMVLLCKKLIPLVREAAEGVRMFWFRWGSEETGRMWKQTTHIEDIRVRGWKAIQRMVALSLIAIGIQAAWLVQAPSSVQKVIERAQSFIKWVRFVQYRLWEGVKAMLNDRGAPGGALATR